MHAWVDTDDRGREVLVRTGTGSVTAVVPVGSDGLLRVEIACDPVPGRARAIRYSVHGALSVHDPLARRAADACEHGARVAWTVRWERIEGVPDELPIATLDLATDARAVVASLAPLPEADVVLAALAEDLHRGSPGDDGGPT